MTETTRRPKELITVPVSGMTCTACERRISKALTALPGVVSATASTRKGTASLITTGEANRASIDRTISALGYGLGRSAWFNRDPQVWRSAAVASVFGAMLVWVVGTGDLAGRFGDLSTGGLLLVLALGLAAGVSTCMAMVGGIVLAISASAASRAAAKGADTRSTVWRTNLAFQAGRIVGFGLLGMVLGAIGASASMSQSVIVVLMIVVAVLMALVGVRLTDLSPRIAGWSPTIPAAVGDRLGLTGDVPARRTAGTLVAGAATFFLPCGFTQAVQVYALSTGSPVQAGAVMAVFALGTTPGLLSLGGLTAAVRGASAERFFRFAGVMVLAFAAINVHGALGVLAPGLFATTAAGTTLSSNVTLEGDVQVLRTSQVANGYEPADATVYAGRQVRWEMDSTALTCASTLYAPDLGIEATLEPGLNVFTFTPGEPGTLRYSCSMGMYHGSITVIEEPATADPRT